MHLRLRRIWSILYKEIIHLRRDPYSLAVILLQPLLLLFIIAYALSTDIKHISTVVWDQSLSQASRSLIESFRNSDYFDINYAATNQKNITYLMNRGDTQAALVIPPDYADQIKERSGTSAFFIMDGTDPMVARSARAYAILIAQNENIELLTGRMAAQTLDLPIDMRGRVWYNPDMKNLLFLAPGLVAFILQSIVLAMSAFAIVREREWGTMEQLLATPIKPAELMVGKLIPYMLLSIIDVLMLVGITTYFFGVPMEGSLLLLLGLSIIFLLSVLGTGLLISTMSRTQYQALQLVIFIIIPFMLLSGLIYPVFSMPQTARYIANAIPLTYFLEIVRGIMLKGNTLLHLWSQTLILLGIGLFIFSLSILRFRKHL